MNAQTISSNWREANQHYLMVALAVLRGVLERYVATQATPEVKDQESVQHEALQEAAAAMPAPSALDRLCKIFKLSAFECHILLLCAGMELDNSFAQLLTTVQPNSQRAYPTFSLALTLPNSYWDVIAPAAPLRYWRLIKIGSDNGITLSRLQIDEQILHYLLGVEHLDERLVGFVEPLQVTGALVPSHCVLVERIVAVWSQAKSSDFPIVQLCGSDSVSKRQIAAAACKKLGHNLCFMPAYLIPTVPSELDTYIRLWNRETLLHTRALLVDCDELDRSDAVRVAALTRLIEHISGIFLSSYERMRMPQRLVISLDVHKPTSEEQRTVWQETLAEAASPFNGEVKLLTAQFNLSPATIRAACAETAEHLAQGQGSDFGGILWDACRVQTRPRLDELAQRITPGVDWENLVLPEAQQQILREIAAHVRQRATVYETWGFGAKGTRGLGISALFAGGSGTGKTLAAEVLAQELRLDLYRIDLSSVVSKYIGETEKNLRQVFDAAEAGGVILLFDEADALFGKRSEVKDSRDRYANIEVSYLLQRLECYPGLAVLTTNLKSALDTAFLRRIRFVVHFPFPDTAQRAEIWRRIFPDNTPKEGLDPDKLAQLNISGGNIRNIALNAAFLAADAGEPVRMTHLLRAAHSEYSKLEKSLTGVEISGWI
jgi:ATPase family associated with various cellular activities (AAA)